VATKLVKNMCDMEKSELLNIISFRGRQGRRLVMAIAGDISHENHEIRGVSNEIPMTIP